ncbi:MAG TPA: hypothetical protein VHN37_01750 [Actinomycetota bacterium]|nr:hypothetical protein [Actinomycetota bacterium]
MDAAEWGALGLAGASFVASAAAVLLSWRWRRADSLLRLHESLRKVKSAALEHLDVYAGEHPTEGDVVDLLEDAAPLARSAPWADVRDTADRLFQECRVVLEPRVRERPHERKESVRREIQEAFEAASATIAARAARARRVGS